jgi:hypothetical protein
MGRSAHSAGPGLTPRRSDTRLAPLASRRRSWRVIDMAQPRPIEDRPARPLVDDSGGAQSLVPGRVSASRLERVQGLPRSLGSGPSPGSQPRPRSPAPRWGGITDPRRTDHQSHAAPAPPTRRAEHQNRSSPPDARPHLPRPPLLPLPPPPPSAAASTSPRRFNPPGSTLPPPIATHGLCPPAGICQCRGRCAGSRSPAAP